jgi:GT2 family glycosyltransferase
MDLSVEPHRMESDPSTARQKTCRVLIAIPFYRNEHLVAQVIGSLIGCASDLAVIGADVVFYNDSPDYPALSEALQAILPSAAEAFPCRIETNPQNLGFVRTMNQAVAEAVARHADLVMLNSDTEIEPGALPEMLRIAALDHMIGFVNPRSNNATIATLPLPAPPSDRAAARDAYQALARMLPELSHVPTAVGFCMLVRWVVLAEFGGFDEIYGQGYNEENDLVMRAGRCGFRAVFANHAFVWHEGEESFSGAAVARDVWEPTNRAILDARYPEYGPYTAAHYDAPETIAERLLAALLPGADGRIDVAFDFSSFRVAHNGTYRAGRQLLAVAHETWGPHANIHVICSREVYEFHAYADLGIPRVDPHAPRVFAAVFRVGQPYDWNVLQRLIVAAPVIGVYMLDTISIDCPQLASPLLYNIWQFTLDHADVIATQSEQTAHQLQTRFTIPPAAVVIVSHHSLDLENYLLPGMSCRHQHDAGAAPRILVVGNHFHHKYLSQTANALARAFPDRQIIALGEPKRIGRAADPLAIPPLLPAANLTASPAGDLSEEDIGALYESADIIVFPSHAEGFGFPCLHALAALRPVFLRRLPVFEELWAALGHTPNFHFYETTTELVALLADLPSWVDHTPPSSNGAKRSADEIKAALDAALGRAGFPRIVERIRVLQLISDLSQTGGEPTVIDNAAAQAARFLAQRVERIARRVFMVPAFYKPVRALFRALRKVQLAIRDRNNEG